MKGFSGIKGILVVGLLSACMVEGQGQGQVETDPHRPSCTSARCRKIKSFLKIHYCGASPFGNGPDDGCEIKTIQKPGTGADVIADYRCEWNTTKQTAECEQHGELPPAVRAILVRELHRAGLPANANGQTYFTLWRSTQSHWSLAVAYYSRQVRSELDLCEVITVIDDSSHAVVVRKLPFQKTDIDVPDVTQWVPIDIADVEGNGRDDIVLEGDAYENHWLEVVSLRDGNVETVFSGLGYYL